MFHEFLFYMPVMGFSSFLVSYITIPLIISMALKRGMLDIPNSRSSHSLPTPRGGGMPIVLIALGGAVIISVSAPPGTLSLGMYPASALTIAAVSLIDDIYSVRKVFRFLVHGICAGLVLYSLDNWNILGLQPGNSVSDSIMPIVALLWLVGFTNSFNFMDGIDGIAGGQAVVAGFGWLLLGALNGLFPIAGIGLLIGCASLGFLLHNWQPARIFMGDVGSTFLGFSFAVLPMLAIQEKPGIGIPGVLLVWPFIFDTFYTFCRRLLKGERVFEAHRSHLYQRLVIAGYSHATVAIIYVALASVGAILALCWSAGIRGTGVAASIMIPCLSVSLLCLVSIVEKRRVDITSISGALSPGQAGIR